MRKSLVSVWALLALPACRSDKPEDQVRRAFEACRAAVEAGDAAGAAEPLDPAFRGPDGMDRATARLFLLGILRQERVGVTVLRNEVVLRGQEAFQEVDLVLTGKGAGWLPQEASRRTLSLRWRRAGGDWKLVEVQSPEGR